MKFLITAAGFLLATLFSIPALAQTRALVTEEMMVKTADPGIEIYVRNKRPADMTSFRPEQTVLYVHGATYPSETAFDLKLDGVSWMEYIASRGYDVWLWTCAAMANPRGLAKWPTSRKRILPSSPARPRSRTSAPPSILSCSAATFRASTFWAGRGARR